MRWPSAAGRLGSPLGDTEHSLETEAKEAQCEVPVANAACPGKRE